MTAFQNWRFSAAGDPNGNRTRVFAVKGFSPLKSTARPDLHASFRALNINDLRGEGDEMTENNLLLRRRASEFSLQRARRRCPPRPPCVGGECFSLRWCPHVL